MVVVFHLQTVLSHGGFIGVDIFFVISGFLITSLLLRELDHGSFSIRRFYVRRIRRLAPALLVMLLFTTAVAYAVLWPFELTNYAWSLLSAVLSVSNRYFLAHLGYFDAQSRNAPLLHTWSLAVEEQFYIVFPCLLCALYRRFKAGLPFILAGLGCVSLATSIYAVHAAPNFAFYSSASRAWELICGSILAVKPLPGMRSALRRNLAGLAGMALITYAFLNDWHYTPFPGAAALPPCIGSVLVIGSASAGETVVSRILSSRPLVFAGLISYSLYLWHWPLIVFLSMWAGLTFQSITADHVVIFALALVLATLSWHFVERPFRTGRKELPASTVFQIAGFAGCIPVAVALVFIGLKGIPQRFSPSAVAVATYLRIDKAEITSRYRTGSCFLTSDLTLNNFDRAKCLSRSKTKPNILVFGDSHAAHLEYGLVRIFPGENFMQATAVSCMPYVMQNIERLRRPADCVSLVDFVLHDYLPRARPDAVILAGHWTPEDLSGVGETIDEVKRLGIKLLLVGPAIEYDIPLPHLLALSIQRSDPGLPQRHIVSAERDLDQRMSDLARTVWRVPYFSYFNAFCTAASCQEYVDGGVPLEQDQAHLTRAGSIVVARKFEEEQFLQ